MGFRLGGYKTGDVTVMEPTVCNIPQAMKDITKVFLIIRDKFNSEKRFVNIFLKISVANSTRYS